MTDTTAAQQENLNADTPAAIEAAGEESIQADSPKDAAPPAEPTLTRADLEAALAKAREQEKSKLYKKLESTTAAHDELTSNLAEKEDALTKLQEKLRLIEDDKLTEQEKIHKQIEGLTQSNEALKKQLDSVASEAARRIQESEIKAYRDRRLRESGVTLTELVAGNTAEEIDAAIAATEAREKEIFAQAAAEAEARIRGELQAAAPKPVSPKAPSASNSLLTNVDRKSVAKLDDAEYAKIRAKLMEEARRSLG